ncbi:MAG: hypothetical protein P3X24_009825 [bacterium]|nr:hypothetical protein [bacterium]
MHARTLRRLAVWGAVAWLITILSAELLHPLIEADTHAAHRECPVCLFHATHGQVQLPEAVLSPVLLLVLTAVAPLPHYACVVPDVHPAFHRSIRAPPVAAL